MKIGQPVSCRPLFASDVIGSTYKSSMDSHKCGTATGKVIYIHPTGRIVTVEFDYSVRGVCGEWLERKIRESYLLRRRGRA